MAQSSKELTVGKARPLPDAIGQVRVQNFSSDEQDLEREPVTAESFENLFSVSNSCRAQNENLVEAIFREVEGQMTGEQKKKVGSVGCQGPGSGCVPEPLPPGGPLAGLAHP